MPTLRDIRKRLKAIASTKKITSAMKMVAAAKLRKVQDRMINFRPYATKMETVLADLALLTTEAGGHPLLVWRPRKKVELVVITSDRGLCGAYNSNILRTASQQLEAIKKEGVEVSVSVVGRKARDYFKRRNVAMRRTWTGLSGRLTYSDAQSIANDIVDAYVSETVDEFIFIFSEFKSMLVQKPVLKRLLPIAEIGEGEASSKTSTLGTFEFEPSRELLFERLMPKYIEIQVYRALLESQASEEAARMTAMENASKNCDDLIKKVTLIANKVRQSSITKELMDIVGGVEALEKS